VRLVRRVVGSAPVGRGLVAGAGAGLVVALGTAGASAAPGNPNGVVFGNELPGHQAGVLDPGRSAHHITEHTGCHTGRVAAPAGTAGRTLPARLPAGYVQELGNHRDRPALSGRLRIRCLVVDPAQPEFGQPVAFTARLAGRPPRSWAWTVTRLADHMTVATSTARTFRYVPDALGGYEASLTITGAGSSDRRSVRFAVTRHRRLDCGSAVTEYTTLTADVVCSDQQRRHSVAAITIPVGGVLLDLGGHTVYGGIVASNGYPAQIDDVTVREGAADRLNVQYPGSAYLADLRLHDLRVEHSRPVEVAGVRIDGLGEPATGVSLLQSDVDMHDSRIKRSAVHAGESRLTLGHDHLADSTVSMSSGRVAAAVTIQTSHLRRSGIIVGGSTYTTASILNNVFDGGDVAVDVPIAPSGTVDIEGNVIRGARLGIRIDPARIHSEVTVAGNLIRDSAAAGILVQGGIGSTSITLTRNTLRVNGFRPSGLTDSAGRSVNDGIHVDAPVGALIHLAGNHTRSNADYGIQAVPGSVLDDGGNTSTGDPNGCLGVLCGWRRTASPGNRPVLRRDGTSYDRAGSEQNNAA
jgi:hypothetical protein